MEKNTQTGLQREGGVVEIVRETAMLIVGGIAGIVGPLIGTVPLYCKWYVPETDSDKTVSDKLA